MVPLQAGKHSSASCADLRWMIKELTEFLLDDLQYLLLVELLGKPLYSSQGLTTIALYVATNKPSFHNNVQRVRVSKTYAEFECEYNFETALFPQCLRRPRRRGLMYGNCQPHDRKAADKGI